MRRAPTVGLIVLAGLLSAGCGMAVVQERQDAAAVGRIDVIDVWGSFVIAEFPEGRRLIHMDVRDLAHYRAGEAIRLDQAGRPLPRRPS